MPSEPTIDDVSRRLIEAGGKTAQDLGFSRIAGQILVYLYLSPEPCSLDAIGEDLGLSKAAISVAASQLEKLGFLRRAWKKGDRKCYYRTADDIASALHHGLLVMIRGKMLTLGDELRFAQNALKGNKADARSQFILKRVERAEKLRATASKVLESPLLKLFAR